MATTAVYHSHDHSHPGERRETLQVKQEPMEDTRGHHAMTTMDMSHQLQQQPTNGRMDLDPARHNGSSPPPLVYGLDFNPYTSPYDQRVANPHAPYPPPSYHHLHHQQQQQQQQHSSPHSHDNHHKQPQLNGYVPQNSLPSPLHTANSNSINQQQQMMGSAEETEDCDDVPVLKIKRSNGKLALPEMLRADGVKGIDMMSLTTHQRAKREFVPDNRKDQGYWTKRVKNNDSARRSRVKRKALEKIMETRLIELQQENIELRHEMNSLKRRFGLSEDTGPAGPTCGGNFNGSLDSVLDGMAPSSPEKLSKEDLEQQSSDDSQSLDDSRSSYNVRSVSALSQSFEPANRDRADSLGSNGSGSPPAAAAAAWREYNSSYVKTDPSGALDLTSDFSARSSSSSSSTSSSQSQSHPNNTNTTDFYPHHPTHPHHLPHHPPPSNSKILDTDNSSLQYTTTHNVVETKMASGGGMRGVPLKCRWKYNSSVNGAPPVDSSA